MKNLFCPANISFLIGCHVMGGGFEVDLGLPIRAEQVRDFTAEGLIEPVDNGQAEQKKPRYMTTLKGQAYVQALCNVPPPTLAYIDSKGDVLVDEQGRILAHPQ